MVCINHHTHLRNNIILIINLAFVRIIKCLNLNFEFILKSSIKNHHLAIVLCVHWRYGSRKEQDCSCITLLSSAKLNAASAKAASKKCMRLHILIFWLSRPVFELNDRNKNDSAFYNNDKGKRNSTQKCTV